MDPDAAVLLERLRVALRDRYAVETEIGRGGMAIVYRARDVRLGRAVAIKVLRPELSATIAADRFLDEIRIATHLQHPNILPIHEAEATGDVLYYVMPYVAGESLQARLDRQKHLAIPDAIRIACEVAVALDYAHQQGIVHRDVKPGNILLSSDRAIVADFGLARAVAVAERSRLTRTGLAVGTPYYMSPEQAGNESSLDGRTDLYALGCVLFEMLAGEPPFTGRSPQAVVARQMHEQPPAIRVVRPAVEPELAEIIGRALAKIPADRFPTCGSFADALQAVSSAAAVRRLRSRRRAIRVALVSTSALVGGLALLVALRPTAIDTDTNKVVVFPLMERGLAGADTGAGYDAALVIGAALEHTDPLKWIDGRQHLDDEDRATPDHLTSRTAMAITRRRGARYFLDGVVRQDRDSTAVVLRLHDGAGDSLIAQETAIGAGVGRAAAHQLGLLAIRRLLPRLLDPGRQVDLDALAERRPAAIALWIQGEREYRRARFSSALDFYKRAVREDSSLAFAAVKGAQAANWVNRRSEARELVRTAVEHEALLPLRYRAFSRGLAAYLSARADSAVIWLEQALAADEQWSEAWMALGDVFYHLFPSRAPLDSLAEAAFERALAADTTFAPPMLHLVEIAARRGDVRRARTLMQRLRKAEPDDSTLVHQRQLIVECVSGRTSRLDWQSAARQNALATLLAAQSLSVGLAQPDCAEDGFRAVIRFAPVGHQWAATVGLHGLLAAQSRLPELTRLLDSAVAAGTSQALWLYVVDAMAGLPVGTRAAAMEEFARRRFGETYTGASPHVLWMVGVWHARLGHASKAETLHTALARLRGPTARRPTLLSDALAAHVLLARADTTQAIASLTRLSPTAGTDSLLWDIFEPLPVERLMLARLLLAKGQPNAAHRVAQVFDHPEATIYLPFIPASLEIRLRSAEILGDGKAASVYRARLRALTRRGQAASR